MPDTSFGTVLTCVDGRVQRPVNDFLVTRFGVANIDTVTRPGIIRHLTASYDPATNSIINDLELSISLHNSNDLAVVAHHDCAGNPIDDAIQHAQLSDAVAHLGRRYPGLSILGLWVGERWTVDVIA